VNVNANVYDKVSVLGMEVQRVGTKILLFLLFFLKKKVDMEN